MPKINKNIIIGISITVILIFTGIIGWVLLQKEKPLVPEEIIEEETIEQKMIQEIDRLRGDQEPYSEEDIEAQIGDLDKLHQQFEVKPLSQEEIKKQIEELDKQRSQQ